MGTIMEMQKHEMVFSARPSEVLKALSEAAGTWGAHWIPEGAGGSLSMPVQYGLRHGAIKATIALEPRGDRAFLTLQVKEEELSLHRSAVAVLLFAAGAALATIFWPLLPALSALVPLALVLGVAAWLLVVSRLRTAGPHEFLASLEETLQKGRTRSQPPE